jgi:hypothetical protein
MDEAAKTEQTNVCSVSSPITMDEAAKARGISLAEVRDANIEVARILKNSCQTHNPIQKWQAII